MSQLWSLITRELRKALESNQIPEGTSRLAGGPYRHQGLLSIVLMTGYDPITSCVSDKCSTNWATWAVADQAGLEPTIPWLTVKCFTIKLLILLWERRDSNPQGFRDRFTVCWANQLLNSPFCTLYRDRTCDLLYVKQPLLPSELRVCFSLLEQI